MDLSKSFTYVFGDPRWVTKVLIGGVLALLFWLIIPSFILVGYFVQIVRNILAGYEHPLPEWNDFGAHLVDGFKVFVLWLVYVIPGFILYALVTVRGVGWLLGLLGFLYLVGIQLFFPAVLKAYLDGGNSIGASFQFSQIIERIRGNIGAFIIVWIIGIVAGFIINLSYLACYFGALFGVPYALVVLAQVWGQLLVQLRDGVVLLPSPAVDGPPADPRLRCRLIFQDMEHSTNQWAT